MKKRKKVTPEAPLLTQSESIRAKKGWLERYHDWQVARKRHSQALYETDHGTIHVVVNERARRPLPQGVQTLRTGLHCGIGSEAELELVQFLEEGERFIPSDQLLGRAMRSEGFRGEATAGTLEANSKLLPVSWQGRRLYFLANFLVDTLDPCKERFILKLEYRGGQWELSLVSFYDNIWTRNDWFVRQRV